MAFLEIFCTFATNKSVLWICEKWRWSADFWHKSSFNSNKKYIFAAELLKRCYDYKIASGKLEVF